MMRERALDAAEACFRERGIATTTMDDVARRAGISRVTLYRHFEGRDALTLAVVERAWARLAAEFAARFPLDGDLATMLEDGLVYAVERLRGADIAWALAGIVPDAWPDVDPGYRLPELLFAFLRPYLERAQAERLLRPGLEVDDAADWYARQLYLLIVMEPRRGRGEAELRRQAVEHVLPGMLASGASAGAAPGSGRAEGRD